MSLMRRALFRAAMHAFAALLGTVLTIAPFPACQRVVAPLLCPKGTVRSIVVVTWSSYQPGEHAMTSDLVCIGPTDRPERVRDLLLMAVIFGGWFLGITAFTEIRRLRAARRSR